ncbi:hypothetical protein AWB68_07992 [Caballeronia choica]|jgi:hypothetical protein|uniref:Uncharacterized protein n=1 Tax=Caballeronia choica TaxID=326476 RepID=A0A158L105_9BURK|nr:hypothetical protein AWB68_07992 [Caballeronia choica]
MMTAKATMSDTMTYDCCLRFTASGLQPNE